MEHTFRPERFDTDTTSESDSARQLLLDASLRADDLSDGCLAELSTHGLATALPAFTESLSTGEPVEFGPATTRFLAHVRSVPAWVDPSALRRGAEHYLAVGAQLTQLSLGLGALVHAYLSPTVAHQLSRTGNFVTMAERRLVETSAWQMRATSPGDMEVGRHGWVATVQVRLTHSRVRAGLVKGGWKGRHHGAPISQFDMAHTILYFATAHLDALARLGARLSGHARNDVYHLWRYIAHVSGVDPELVVDSHHLGRQLLAQIESMYQPADDASRGLVDALAAVYADRISNTAIAKDHAHAERQVDAFLTLFHGTEIATRLQHRAASTPDRLALLRSVAGARSITNLIPPLRAARAQQTLRDYERSTASLDEATYERSTPISAPPGLSGSHRRIMSQTPPRSMQSPGHR